MKVIRPALVAAAVGFLAAGSHVQAQTAAGSKVEPVRVKAIANFDFDRSDVKPQDQSKLLADVAKMTDVTWQAVVVTGHTDSIGSAAYNSKLSERRAQAVKSYLVGKGLDSGMVNAGGKGLAEPVASNDSIDGRRQNRRTEIEFQGVRAGK